MIRSSSVHTVSILMVVMAAAAFAAEPAPRKVVTVGPAITDTLFALGAGDQVVGIDDSSVAIPSASRARKVGYQRLLSAEGLLALGAQLLLATAEAGPPAVLDQLRAAGVTVVVISNEPTVEATRHRIQEVARAVGQESRGQALIAALDQDLARAAARVQSLQGKKLPRVLAIHARGAGALMVAGHNTTADTLIRLAGGVNVITSYDGYRPLTAEAVVQANPDIVLLPKSSLEGLGGAEGVARLPGLSALRGWRVATVDDVHIMGFGPHLGQAVEQLLEQLHPREHGTP